MENSEMQFKNLKFVFGILSNLFLIVLTLWFSIGVLNQIKERRYIGNQVKNTLVVFATGEVFSKPDLAIVNFSVVNEALTVEKALSENTDKANSVINFLKNQEIQEKDIKTIVFNINPRYEWQKERRILVGYEVKQSLEVKIRDFSKIGEIIEGAIKNGANIVENLQLTIENKEELKNKAREIAIKRAKEKAQAIASQLEVKLVKITNFTENEGAIYPERIYFNQSATPEFKDLVPQINVGENKIQIEVAVTFEII